MPLVIPLRAGLIVSHVDTPWSEVYWYDSFDVPRGLLGDFVCYRHSEMLRHLNSSPYWYNREGGCEILSLIQ